MKIAKYNCKCGSNDFFFGTSLNDPNDMHVGIYCNKCGKWLKWANKDERNLMIKPRTMISLAHEVKLIDERLHDLEVKHEK